ncbi:hypothetical protein CYCD_27750 [Tenuifilaceae bacterium CYCD]|nr:hypothetical protein CYCD_27750 [Tenuifilaceae bacterium CYCD]
MPSFNQTGPMGQGSMTGRKMGRCTNFGTNLKRGESAMSENLENQLSTQGRGFGFGRGRGRGGSGFGMGRQNRFRGNI